MPYARDALSRPPADSTRLDCLLEYTYSGLVWQANDRPITLPAFLRKHGVPLPGQQAQIDALCRGGDESPLAKYVRANLRRDAAFWRSTPLSLAVVEERIVGDVQERLLRFLADPEREWQALQAAGIGSEFCSQVGARYADVQALPADPAGWARAFVESLALLEVDEATGRRDDFPYRTKLPAAEQRPAQRQLLKDWMQSRDHYETYARHARALGDLELTLRPWARETDGRPQGLRGIAEDRWSAFLKGLLAQQESQARLRTYLLSHREIIAQEAAGFWARGTGDLPGWELAARLITLMERAEKAVGTARSLTVPSHFVRAYADQWHAVDLAHWRLLAAARKADDGEAIAAIADRFYVQYLEQVNQAFYGSLGKGGTWPPESCQGVAGVTAELYQQSGTPQAILIVDALRFDLAAALCERLEDAQLGATIANVPSDTWVGMTSLLPGVSAELRLQDGDLALYSEATQGDLTAKANRWKALDALGASALGSNGGKGRRDAIDDLLRQVTPPKALPKLLVLFDRGADNLGHPVGYEVLHHFEVLLDNLEHAVRKLKAWGYGQVRIVTDHGFVLLHDGASVPLMGVNASACAKRTARWCLQRAGEEAPTVTVPFALDDRWQVALAPGLRSFGATGAFFHGGATLQEVVIPDLRVAGAAGRQRMRVTTLLPQTEIATLAVKVVLMPERPPRKDLFEGEPEPIRLRLFLGAPDAPRSREKELTLTPEQTEPISVTLFLDREPPTPLGSEIAIQVLDADTGESYASGLVVRAVRDLN
ncbi:MAG: PglZ domain-containing protein [Chloroflexi bacterium]|nr:PglZ domain-containing protein [Chloroflexota bacterium]